jgi:ABC-type glycerol-3-phosphate transport system substrate-binding protein
MSCNNLQKKATKIAHIWMLLPLLLLTACSCAKTPPPGEPATITFAYPDSEAERYEALIAKFNENYPHITINRSADNGDDDGGADVFFASPFSLNGLLEQNAVLALDPLIGEDGTFAKSDFYPGTMELFTSEDKLWAIPAGVTVTYLTAMASPIPSPDGRGMTFWTRPAPYAIPQIACSATEI